MPCVDKEEKELLSLAALIILHINTTAELPALLKYRRRKIIWPLIYSSLFPLDVGLLLKLNGGIGKHLSLPNCCAGPA